MGIQPSMPQGTNCIYNLKKIKLDMQGTIKIPLKPNGSVCTAYFNIQKLYTLSHIFIFVLLTGWAL
jgi:hypothetical protein